jgi:hypothetical protein
MISAGCTTPTRRLHTYLGNDRDVLALTPLQVPNQKNLLSRSVVLVGNFLQGLVVGQGRVGGSET